MAYQDLGKYPACSAMATAASASIPIATATVGAREILMAASIPARGTLASAAAPVTAPVGVLRTKTSAGGEAHAGRMTTASTPARRIAARIAAPIATPAGGKAQTRRVSAASTPARRVATPTLRALGPTAGPGVAPLIPAVAGP